ncbi:MAG TPA: glycoside-pentoside-hexuronide (GPH):cation symporter [Bacilli bacterium]|jgi:sugar (glycoside-pentoside-hexuronide) transporter|nr:glycoside-pentoside-hexuronide (GPH):cation symporter [Bacilli bacterium]HOR17523.1 glycoside-pentoside-hexuronide (GPH):cation symporter [Bacilli bacterium]
MENNIVNEEKIFNRNKWCYSLGGIGRDMTYTLMATFLMVYIQYTMNLTIAQFSTISFLLVLGRVWDAINDPIMGAIIENTKSRWGKFKPWIIIGAVLTAIVIVILFNVRTFTGWNFVIFFAVSYFIWEITFTMNDISYWSMLASLSTDAKKRNKITTLAVVFAGVGAFAANAIIALASGDMVRFYGGVSIGIAFALVACQTLTVLGVKEDEKTIAENNAKEENVSFKDMILTIKNNDQLLWVTLAMFLYNIGSSLLGSTLAYNMIYLEINYGGIEGTLLVLCLGVSSIMLQSFYASLANKFKRSKLLIYSLSLTLAGYLMLLLLGFTFIPINIITICIFAIFVFSGQAIFYMVLTVNLTNTIEYNEYKTGERREGVIFSLRPFMAKFASAVTQLIITGILIFSGIYALTENVSILETQKNDFESKYIHGTLAGQAEYLDNLGKHQVIFDQELQEKLNEIEGKEFASELEKQQAILEANQEIDDLYNILEDSTFTLNPETGLYTMDITPSANKIFKSQADNNLMKFILRGGITIVPILFLCSAFLVLKKKYKIDEEMYEHMMAEINKKKQE